MDDFIGYLAACLTTLSFLPQAWHTFRTRDVSGISTGVALLLLYGLRVAAWPVVAANAVTLALALCILGMKLRFARRNPDRPDS